MKFETLEELVEQRRGYKYLNKDFTSPYKGFKYDKRKHIFKTDDLDEDLLNDCGSGFNLATLDWILNDSHNLLNQVIIEFEIPKEAKIIVPHNSNGKFRTNIIKKKKVYKLEYFLPQTKKINNKLKNYKPTNPITAEKCRQKIKLKK